tara:strand:- start:52 stop:246 length:195 start_codon:yes stop_codon:yes gene_type:complete
MRNNNNNEEKKMTIKIVSKDDKNFVVWAGTREDFKRDFPNGPDEDFKRSWKIVIKERITFPIVT